jgi:L-ascorbate metabolism protein UlaG (beta-lactamase superfamily)
LLYSAAICDDLGLPNYKTLGRYLSRRLKKRKPPVAAASLVILALAVGHLGAQDAAKENRAVTIEYIAHACFRVTSPSGRQVLIDPYASRVWLGYDFPPDIRADAVLISHPHYDHDGGEAMKRPVPWPPKTLVLRQPGTNQIGDIAVIGFTGKHADPWGKEFGQINTIWLLQVAGLRIVHLGDNGPLRDETIREIGRVDVLMIPIDSQFHILKADQIAAIRSRLSPPILIPMHYRHSDLEPSPDKPEQLGGIEDWAKGEANVRSLASHKTELSFATLPKKPELVIFKHSPLVKAPLSARTDEAEPSIAQLQREAAWPLVEAASKKEVARNEGTNFPVASAFCTPMLHTNGIWAVVVSVAYPDYRKAEHINLLVSDTGEVAAYTRMPGRSQR